MDKIYERWEVGSQTPKTALQWNISGYAPMSNHVFAQLIFMLPELYLMPRFESINFYQNKPEIKLFLQKKNFFWGALGALHFWLLA